MLFEHPRAAGLPLLLADTPTPAELAQRLGPPLEPGVISDLLAAEFLIGPRTVHYGRTPRYAGFGLYWGAVSFTSTQPRR